MVVLDALAYGVPVICTQGTPWKLIEERKCGWWIAPNSSRALVEALVTGMHEDDISSELRRRNARMLASEFSWTAVTDQMIKEYHSSTDNMKNKVCRNPEK